MQAWPGDSLWQMQRGTWDLLLHLLLNAMPVQVVVKCIHHLRDVGSIQKVGGGTCVQGHPYLQERGNLYTNF